MAGVQGTSGPQGAQPTPLPYKFSNLAAVLSTNGMKTQYNVLLEYMLALTAIMYAHAASCGNWVA